MDSPKTKTAAPAITMKSDLAAQLQRVGLCAVPNSLDDFLARATKATRFPSMSSPPTQ